MKEGRQGEIIEDEGMRKQREGKGEGEREVGKG